MADIAIKAAKTTSSLVYILRFLSGNVQCQSIEPFDGDFLPDLYFAIFGDSCPAFALEEYRALRVQGLSYCGCLTDELLPPGRRLFAMDAYGPVGNKPQATAQDNRDGGDKPPVYPE